ncbi:hypothetical protein DRQ09_05545 [candidate division KSB1 bacterium]|nr:MAG: hypothetical protein DRQ09_05545 [candidate division KSB1 bacterium]
MKKFLYLLCLCYFIMFIMNVNLSAQENPGRVRFEITFPSSVHPEPITGRVYVMISRNDRREPRFQIGRTGVPFFGVDVERLRPGQPAVIDETVLGSPVESLKDIPPGDYYVQGFINIYTEFHRSDGYVVWLHNDQWEGQRWRISPGNIYSDVMKVHLDSKKGYVIKIEAENVIPPVKVPPDTKWVKRIKFQSKLLTKFWGRPIYLGATILLPKGYDENPALYYPVDYIQGHFSLRAPYGFTTEKPEPGNRWAMRGYEFYKSWISDKFPRMILVTFQHPCPYFDDSYAVNSANCGPYGDAIMTELIPYIEKNFRIIRKPYARILEGGSTGGWESLALQIFHPDFFGGCFSYCPDPVDFRDVEAVNIYKDKNAYYREYEWRRVVTPNCRRPDGSLILTSKQRNYFELVCGTKGRSGEQWDIWMAVFGPVGEDGYTKPLFNKVTGEIDPSVAQYWKEHYDLRYYLEKNWSTIGPKLIGKLHIFTGDMDTYYLNNAVHMLQDFMEQTQNPHYTGFFWYAPRKPHCWAGPFTPAERIKFFATHIAKNTPPDIGTPWWRY